MLSTLGTRFGVEEKDAQTESRRRDAFVRAAEVREGSGRGQGMEFKLQLARLQLELQTSKLKLELHTLTPDPPLTPSLTASPGFRTSLFGFLLDS